MQNKWLSLILLLNAGLLNACGHEDACDYKIMHVCIIFDDPDVGPSREYLLNATNWYFNKLEEISGMSARKTKQTFKTLTTITFETEVLIYIKKNGEESRAAGLYYYNITYNSADIRIWVNSPCIGETAYFHEVSHHIAYHLFRDQDLEHNDPLWWGADGFVNQLNEDFAAIDTHTECIQE